LDKRIAVVALALLVVAGAFLAWPSSPVAGGVAAGGGATGEAATGLPMSTDGGPPPPPEPETELTIKCTPMRERLTTIYSEPFAKVVGTAAKAKYGTDDAVIVECEKHISLTDDQIKAWVEGELGVHP
jgi:hypothetical protein